MLQRAAVGWLAGLLVVASACDDSARPTGPEATEAASPSEPRFSWEDVEYPLHFYGDATDEWPYLTSVTPTYTEIVADDQTPRPGDNDPARRVCPNDQYVGRNAHLRMNYGLETLDFDFRGPFTFIRHVSTTSPYPTALYTFNRNAYTRDNKYYAPAGNNVLLACDGRYVVRNNVIRLWVGHLYGKLYNGPIVRNPDYDDCEDGSGGSLAIAPDVSDTSYEPYDPRFGLGGGGSCGDSGGGGDGPSSGTEYEPGDYTGGETVDWSTGIGNGGRSACGDDAMVDYVCIDYWVDGVGWVEWGCGYVTTC